MSIYRFLLLTGIVGTAVFQSVTAQPLSREMTDRIDSLFHPWVSGAGCAVGVVRNDSLIFANGYGMANVEYGVPITPETVFNMASVSKQVTAYCVLLLERQGRLRLEDDIHKYLVWFPDLKEKITILNLLNHTSGIRDQVELQAIAGTALEDLTTQEYIIRILAKQRGLNFKPGTDWSYTNSGYTLLAEIVRAASGQPLRRFADSAIFQPLGMKHTHFHDDYREVVQGLAYPYSAGLRHQSVDAFAASSNVGPTGLLSTVDDMSKWIMNFYDPVVGDRELIRELTEPVIIDGTKKHNYAKGIVVDSIYGRARYQHGGVAVGYQTFVSVFPDLKMGFIVFSNLQDVNVQRLNEQVAALFIKDVSIRLDRSARRDSALAILTDTVGVRGFTGDFIADDATRYSFVVRDRKFYVVTPNGRYHLLLGSGVAGSSVAGSGVVSSGAAGFELYTDTAIRFVLSVSGGGRPVIDEYWPAGNHLHLEKYDRFVGTDAALAAYTGAYYCPELDCIYRIVLKEHRLFLGNMKYGESPLTFYGADHLLDDFWWMGHLHMLRNGAGRIVGFELNGNRTMHLRFERVDCEGLK